jgi:hypothetical protein
MDMGPLPGVAYGSTMTTADIYPAVLGVGGIRSRDYTIPVYAERVVGRQAEAIETAATVGAGLFDTPAGWLTLILLALGALVLYHSAR